MYRRPPRSANSDCRCCSPNGVAAHLALRGMVASTAVLRRRTKLSLHAPCIRETRKCDRSRAAHTPLCRGQLRKRAPTGSHGAPPGPRSCGGMRRAFRTARKTHHDMVVKEPWRVLGSRPCRSHADGTIAADVLWCAETAQIGRVSSARERGPFYCHPHHGSRWKPSSQYGLESIQSWGRVSHERPRACSDGAAPSVYVRFPRCSSRAITPAIPPPGAGAVAAQPS